MSQRDQLLLSRSRFMPFREETLFQISCAPGLWHILGDPGGENWKIHAFICKEISTTPLLSVLRRLAVLRFVFILRLFCVYIFVLHIGCYHTLSMIAIYCIKVAFFRVFMSMVNSGTAIICE